MFSTIRRSVLVTLLLVSAASAASAQLSGPGLQWQGSSGTSAGSFLPGCVTHPVSAVVGETVTLQVWGDFQAPFVLFASLNESTCLTFPGIAGGLLLGFPIFQVSSGVLTQISPCLSCPAAFAELVAQIPPTAVGAKFSLQAASLGFGQPGFTVAIRAAVQ